MAYSGAMYPLQGLSKIEIVQFQKYDPGTRENNVPWYLLRANDSPRIRLDLISAKNPGHAKVWDFGVQLPIEQDVARFEIPMYDSKPGVLVKIKKTSSDPTDDVKPPLPI